MPRRPIHYPVAGLSENVAFNDQPPYTSQELRNERSMDPITGRIRGAQRAGMERLTEDPIADGPVRLIKQVVYDAQNQAYTDLGSSPTIEWSKASPTNGDAAGLVLDKQSNVYTLDGGTGVVKENSAGLQLWKLAVPTEDKNHVCRALAVDLATGFFYVGVSAGGKPDTARLFCYRQKDDEKVEKLWQVTPGGYIEQVKVFNTELYALLNFPDQNKAYVRVYSRLISNEPEQTNQWAVPYPASDIDVSLKDSSVFIASAANAQRGLDFRSPSSSQQSIDWQPTDLTSFSERIYAWHDASDRNTLSITPRSPESGDEGGEVVVWYDKSKKNRNWYANRQISGFPKVSAFERGPVYRGVGIGGLPSISFTGAAYNGFSDAASAGRSMAGEPASSSDRSYRNDQLSPFPTYKGAQFVWCAVVKCGIDSVIRGLIGIPSGTGGTNTSSLMLNVNRRDDNQIPGTIPMPGSLNIRSPGAHASDSGTSTPAAGGPSGPQGPMPGMLSNTGLAVLTWIHDGGVHDQVGTATRSEFRVNGHPCDRWQSLAFYSLVAPTLGINFMGSSGHSRFAGEIGEMIVLSDWYDQAGAQQRLVTVPSYPDSAWAANGDTEVERLEGYLAHKWGLAAEMETGQADWMTVTQPVNNETLDIDTIVYRFRTTGNALAQANDVRVGTTAMETAGNLYSAINRIGEPGIDYDQRTVKHPTFIALAAIQPSAAASAVIGVRSISPYAAQVTLAASSGGHVTWQSATTELRIAGAGSAFGWYPHPFALKKTNSSRGGPPSTGVEGTNTQGQVSASYLLQSPYPMLSKWASNTGKPSWVATTGYNVVAQLVAGNTRVATSSFGMGGVGFGVKVNSAGEIYSLGPKQAVVAGNEAVTADAIDLRKFGDTGQTFTATAGAVGDPWVAALFTTVSFTSSTARMDVDAFDNLYAPVFQTDVGDPHADFSGVGYRRAAGAGGLGQRFFAIVVLPAHNEAYAIAADPKRPTFHAGDTVQHGEFLYLATRIESADTTHQSTFKIKQLLTSSTSGSIRTTKLVAVCEGNVVEIDADGISTIVPGGDASVAGEGLDPDSQYCDGAILLSELFLTDGKSYKVYNPQRGNLADYASKSSGLIPPRCKLIASWNGRIVLARPADNAHQWFMSKQGDPYDWDVFPFTITEAQAVAGADSRTNVCPDMINALISLRDDLLIFGGDHSIHRMTGDPMAGGSFHPVSQETGIAFGRSFARDPEGYVYFFGTTGGVYRMDGAAQGATRISLNKIERRLQSVDFANYRIEMEWNHAEDALRVFQVPYGDGGAIVQSWTWERKTDSWHEDTFARLGVTTYQPTTIYVADGDSADDRKLLYGCEDGRIRAFSKTATSDDGNPIDSFALIGPLAGGDEESEGMFTDFELVTSALQQGPYWSLYTSPTADRPMHAVARGLALPGRAQRILARARGANVWFGIGLADKTARWSFESLSARVEPMGIKRALVS